MTNGAENNFIFDIFFEAAHHASIVPLASEMTLYAMKAFGGFALELPVIAAIAGAIFGHCFNLCLGQMLMRLPSSPKNNATYQKIAAHFNRYGFYLLIFAPIPLGNILTIAAGMLGLKIKKALPPIALGLIFWYGRVI